MKAPKEETHSAARGVGDLWGLEAVRAGSKCSLPSGGGSGLHPSIPTATTKPSQPGQQCLSSPKAEIPPPQVLILEKKGSESLATGLPPARWLLQLCLSDPLLEKGGGEWIFSNVPLKRGRRGSSSGVVIQIPG